MQHWVGYVARISGFILLTGCTFNFDVTGQRTALENQVMGSYRELDDDLILASSVRAVTANKKVLSTSRQNGVNAKLNQQFNQDDLAELEDLEILGESSNGAVVILPTTVSHKPPPTKAQLELAKQIIDEENRDRASIWQRIIESNPNLAAKDLPQVRKTYVNIRRQALTPGQWYQDEAGIWVKKVLPAAGTGA